jgi:hypothetical protein
MCTAKETLVHYSSKSSTQTANMQHHADKVQQRLKYKTHTYEEQSSSLILSLDFQLKLLKSSIDTTS